MNENKTTTYGDLKNHKQEMRNKGTIVTEMEEYIQTINAIKEAEAGLLWSITHDEAYGELVKPKTYKRVRYAVIAISIAVIVMIVCCGCQTLKGATGDTAWMLQKLSDNVQIEK